MRLPGNSTISKLAFFDVLIARFPWQRRRGGTPWLKEVLPALAAVEGPTPLQATTLVMSLLSPTAFPQCHQQRFLTSFPQNKQINTCKKIRKCLLPLPLHWTLTQLRTLQQKMSYFTLQNSPRYWKFLDFFVVDIYILWRWQRSSAENVQRGPGRGVKDPTSTIRYFFHCLSFFNVSF